MHGEIDWQISMRNVDNISFVFFCFNWMKYRYRNQSLNVMIMVFHIFSFVIIIIIMIIISFVLSFFCMEHIHVKNHKFILILNWVSFAAALTCFLNE